MEITTFFMVNFLESRFSIVTMTETKYTVCIYVISLINIYICMNSYFMMKYRDDKYYTNEYVFGFYSMWTDWMMELWLDLYY